MSTYFEGYQNAETLIAEIEDISLAILACPPAMPEAYQAGFLAACADAKDKAEAEKSKALATRRNRPNKNYILQVMRDADLSDPWGTAMAWGFAVAECLTVLGEDTYLDYQPSFFVAMETPETYTPESYEDAEVWAFLVSDGLDAPDMDAKIAEVQTAAKCLDRYIDWCKAAGKDY